GLLALAGCQNFAPILAIGDAVDQGIAREAAQVAEQAVAGIEISGVDQQQTRVVEERDADDERGDPAGAVQAADIHPGNNAAADGNVAFVNFDGGTKGQNEEEARGEEKKAAGNIGDGETQGDC